MSGLFGSSSSGGTQKTTTTQQPWAPAVPYLTSGLQRAESLYNSPGPQYFPGSTVSGFSPAQQQAQQLGIQRATNGNPIMGASQNYAQQSINGDFLNSGDQNGMVFQNIASKILPAVNSQFSMSGRYGSGLHADTLGRSLTEAYAPIAMDNYQRERGMQQDMAQFAPTYAANDYQDLGMLNSIGQEQQGQAQSELQDAVNRWSYNQDLPYNKLQQYMGLITGTSGQGGTTTSQMPYSQPSMLQTLLGGGLAAAGTAGQLGWRPFGTGTIGGTGGMGLMASGLY